MAGGLTRRSRTGRTWRLREAPGAGVDRLVDRLGVHPLTATVLAARGYDVAEAGRFLAPDAGALHDPALLLGLAPALARIERAVAAGEHLRLVTDYDVDGTTSCLILHAALDRRIAAARSAARVSYHLPDRFTEGYGLSARAVDAAAADGVTLLITADIGVRDHASVSRARAAGIDVVVVDHHLPAGEAVPADALAVICPPQAGCRYPNKALAACGVSLKLATALLAADPRREELLGSMLKLAAIGTVADVVDLATPENRAIVSLGLARLNAGPHAPGLQALLDVAGLRVGEVGTSDLGFRIGPRINAAGRLDDATAVVRLFRERDPAAARGLAAGLERLNRERQAIQEEMVERALARVGDDPAPFLVVAGPEEEGWHRGVNGIVAARLRDRLHRPAAVASILGPTVTGSVRSVPKVHAVKALDAAARWLLRYGGHPVAAGFTLATTDLAAFTEALQAFVTEHCDDDALVAVEDVDARVPRGLDLAAVADLARLEPCGKGNPAPKLLVEGAVSAVRVVKDRHVFFRAGATDVVWWGGAERRALLDGAGSFLGTAELSTWGGRQEARLVLDDVA